MARTNYVLTALTSIPAYAGTWAGDGGEGQPIALPRPPAHPQGGRAGPGPPALPGGHPRGPQAGKRAAQGVADRPAWLRGAGACAHVSHARGFDCNLRQAWTFQGLRGFVAQAHVHMLCMLAGCPKSGAKRHVLACGQART